MASGNQITFTIEPRGEISSALDFVGAVFELRKSLSNEKLWYRGLSRSTYQLIPTIGRELEYAEKSKTFDKREELDLLHRFRRRAYPMVGRIMGHTEAMLLARHHGLPTRLLDWTASPLFALYFA